MPQRLRVCPLGRLRTGKGNDIIIRPEPALRFSSLLMVRDAVLAGAGAAMLPKLLVADDLAAGRLVQWGTLAEPEVEIWGAADLAPAGRR